uniref:Uncharacterized protein n=1 Tax=Anguilla anguilla TaxID=7936 RepID=A0A0E9RRH8_ANGAN
MQNNFSRISSTSQFHPPLFQFCIKNTRKNPSANLTAPSKQEKKSVIFESKWRTIVTGSAQPGDKNRSHYNENAHF